MGDFEPIVWNVWSTDQQPRVQLEGVTLYGMECGFGPPPADALVGVVGTVVATDGDTITVDFESPAMAAERLTAEAAAKEAE